MVSTGVTFSGAPQRPVWCVAHVVGDTQRRPSGREKWGRTGHRPGVTERDTWGKVATCGAGIKDRVPFWN